MDTNKMLLTEENLYKQHSLFSLSKDKAHSIHYEFINRVTHFIRRGQSYKVTDTNIVQSN